MPRRVKIGVAASLVLYLSLGVLSALTLPWRGTLDSPDHLDYVYQLSNGHLPDAQGLEFAYPGEPPLRGPDAPQYAASHPPGYYAVAATVMGPLLAGGHWVLAVAAGRALNIAIGAAGALALAWAGWRLGGPRREVLAVATPTMGALLTPYLRLSGDIYNDLATTACSVAGVTLSLVVLRDGLTRRRLAALAVIAAAGLATKATFIATIGVMGLAVTIRVLRDHRPRWLRGVAASARAGAVLVAVPLVTIGWFYVRNWRVSGSWFRAADSGVSLQGRPYRSLGDVLTDVDFYDIVPTGLVSGGRGVLAVGSTSWATVSRWTFAAALLLCLLWLVRSWIRRRPSFVATASVALLVLHLALFAAAQAEHASSYGAYNIRYFLPALLTIALLLATAVVSLGRLAAPALAAFVGLAAVALAVTAHTYAVRRYPALVDGLGVWDGLRAIIDANEVPAPTVMLVVLVGLAAVSGTATALSLHRLAAAPAADGPAAGAGAGPPPPRGAEAPGTPA